MMKRARSVEISRSYHELGYFASVINKTLGVNDRLATV